MGTPKTPAIRDPSALELLRRRSLFWDVDPQSIDFASHRRWVVARVLSYGTWDEILALFQLYGAQPVREAIEGNRSIDPEVARFWLRFAPAGEGAAVFHTEVLDGPTRELLEKHPAVLAQPGFVLCGGTAVALRLGHRQSDDLDFLTMGDFDSGTLLDLLAHRLPDAHVVDRKPNTLHMIVSGVKLSYLTQRGIRIEPRGELSGVPVASDGSLAVLKANAVAGRGSKKDFIDLYEMFQRGMTMDALMREVERRAPGLNRQIVLRSLTYFDDAEPEPMPRMRYELKWEQVKSHLSATVAEYVQREVRGPHF